MALMKCKECSAEISNTADKCPQCGARLPKPKLWLWIPVGLIGAFFLFGATVGNSPEAQAKARARDAIDLCWKEQGRKSFDSATQRFVAGACEMMEDDFRRKFGVNP